ncbi:InlB B-repeat-containing protein [Lysinibacillus piscis]|uniref:SLH domain-containing protein n=1 Tax=Lysinibacillus piscis TaxID=2518931 RepID=A0ABQ5NGY4_9BACI|nr:InlB B-repeat-containing protein [Lysinibacillus sp. KH24]GLC87627.1 hypothetical protein LYSBPC_07540 [Lysinibacillus sp. KH24]
MKKSISMLLVYFLVAQAFFGSFPIEIASATTTLTVDLQTNGQPYNEGDVATKPVSVQVTVSSSDSASVQLSQDLGISWQPFDVNTPLFLTDEGTHHVWLRIGEQGTIEKREISIASSQKPVAIQTLMLTTPPTAIIYVNEAVTGGDGTSWANAYSDLQTALGATVGGEEIWIAKGTYKPTTGTDRTISFQMKNNVAIYGGFDGTIETETKETRNFVGNETVLSGDIDAADDDSYHVVYNENVNSTAILDGVTIQGGNADNVSDGTGLQRLGGGMYNKSSSPALTNVKFRDNRAHGGAGMHNDGSSPTLTNVQFSSNISTDSGGGMQNSSNSKAILEKVQFIGNKAANFGGGMMNWVSSPILTNVRFEDNKAQNGGGMHNYSSSPIIKNSQFIGNIASNAGGGLSSDYGSIQLINVLFKKNNALNTMGHTIRNMETEVSLINVTIVDNGTAGSLIYNSDLAGSTNLSIQNSLIIGDNIIASETRPYTLTRNNSFVGKLDNIKFYDNAGIATVDTYKASDIFKDFTDFRLKVGSPAIDKGNNLYNNETTDLDGKARLKGTIDVGAYEFPFYKITYDKNGAMGAAPIDSNEYDIYDTVSVASEGNLTKTGFTFNGWNTQADGNGTNYAIGSSYIMGMVDAILYAKWERALYQVTFHTNGGTAVAEQSIVYEGMVNEPAEPTRAGSTFTGWYTAADTKWDFMNDKVTDEITLYAKWTKNNYKVTFNVDGGTETAEQTIAYEGTVNEPSAPIRIGHTFAGWYTAADTKWDFTNDKVTDEITLYAKWTKNNYKVTFNTDGMDTVAEQSIAYEGMIDEPSAPIRIGHTFAGWYKEMNFITKWNFAIDKVTNHLTLYAKWLVNESPPPSISPPIDERQETYIIEFNTNGGTTVASQKQDKNNKLTEPPIPTKTGYIFAGWYTDSVFNNKWDFSTNTVERNVILYAKWIEHVEEPTDVEENTDDTTEQEESLPPTCNATFTDITSYWAQSMIEDIAGRCIIKGYPDGTFKPDAPIQRQHVAVLFARTFELAPTREIISFNDIPAEHLYYDAIMKVYQAGIFDGTDGQFKPNAYITRAQMAKVFVLAFDLDTNGTGTATFQDVPATHWAKDYIATLGEYGIALGDNGNFKPDEPVTRAQFVAFMYRALHL